MLGSTRFYIAKIFLFVAFFSLAVLGRAFAYLNIPWDVVGSAAGQSWANGPTGRVVLTNNTGMEASAMWDPCSFNLNQNFDIFAVLNLGSNNITCGADGMAFVVQNTGTNVVGADSGEHGYSNGGIANSFAVPFDTYQNVGTPYFDPNYDSLNIVENGSDQSAATGCPVQAPYVPPDAVTLLDGTACRPPISSQLPIVTDGQDREYEFSYNASTYTLTVNLVGDPNNPRAVYQFSSNPVTTLFGGNSSVYFGFTASTGGSTNWEQAAVVSASFNGVAQTMCNPTPTIPAQTATPIEPTPNTCGATQVPTFTPEGPTYTPTITPTPYPPSCGTPVLVQSPSIIFSANPNASNTVSYTVPAVANSLLLIRIESGGGQLASSVTYNGLALTDAGTHAATYAGGVIETYYLKQPPAGSFNLVINIPTGGSWNVGAELYSKVNQTNPIGTITTATGSAQNFSTNITTIGTDSLIDDYLAIQQVHSGSVMQSLGAGQNNFNYVPGCCEETFGDNLDVGPAGPYSMSYNLTQSKSYTSQLMEIEGNQCSPPTDTPTDTFTMTVTPSDTKTRTMTPSPSPTPSLTATPTFTFSVTATPSKTATATQSVTVTGTYTLTASPSKTATPSLTATPSSTYTVTPSPSPTATFSVTVSPTATYTKTPSPSPSATPTVTATPTATYSKTPSSSPTGTSTITATPTATYSKTPSPTSTATPSITVSATPTYTKTPSPSPSDTPSLSSSPTPTSSSSNTPSITATPSETASPTGTFTVTVTSTFSDTATRTVTSQFTPSNTPSFTDSPTASATSTVTATETSSPTSTASPSVSATPSNSPPDTLTDTPSLSPSETASPSPTASSTQSVSSSPTPSDTPSSTSSATYTSTATHSATPSFSPSVTASPSSSASPSITPTLTISPTPQSLPMNLQVTIYNSAGEVVRHLYSGSSQFFTGFTMSSTVFQAGSNLELEFGGAIQGGSNEIAWQGTNDQGQAVSGGIYTIQVKLTNSFGQVSSWTQSVNVLPPPTNQSLAIYNSAGELVYSFNMDKISSLPLHGLGIVENGKAGFAPGGGNLLQFVMSDSQGNVDSAYWDGRSNAGQLVASGSYDVELISLNGAQSDSESKGFIVLEGPQASFGVVEGPNPLGPGQHIAVFEITGLQNSETVAIKVYDVAGELVARYSGNPGQSLVGVPCDRWPAGIYAAMVQLYSGPVIVSQKTCMIAVDR